MGLPEGLQVYAENIFRRFPEEFIALGCPRLEEDFSLQSSTRRITDMGSSKSLEIVLRKGPMSPSRPDEPKPVISSAQGSAALANQVTALHARLAQLERREEPQDHGARGPPAAQYHQDHLSRHSPSAGDRGGERTPSTLAARRGRDVQIDVPNKPAANHQPAVREATAAQPSAAQTSPEKREEAKAGKAPARADLNGRDQADTDKRGTAELSRPESIRATRVMPTTDEPESPRSPGWFSAWGKEK
jgi:hypothetical protein